MISLVMDSFSEYAIDAPWEKCFKYNKIFTIMNLNVTQD